MNRLVPLFVVLYGALSGVAGSTFLIRSHFIGSNCDGTPYIVTAEENSTCTETETCAANDGNTSTVAADMISVECTTDYIATMRQKFGDSPYILQINFLDESCSTFSYGYGFPASGNCEGSFNQTQSYYVIGQLDSNGSTSIQYFSQNPCLADSWYMTQSANSSTLTNHLCDANWFKWYSSNDVSSSSGGGVTLTDGAIIGIAVGFVSLVLVGLAIIVYRRRKTAKRDAGKAKWPASSGTDPVNFDEMIVRGQEGLWNDDVVTAKRIPRDKVTIKKVISRGAYGEVHLGHFNGRQVAVKMLLPSTRGSLNYVNEFLAEAKMTAALDHPHIVSCVGIAWDSLADLCVVLEFVEGGDLRALLNGYLALNHPVGFDSQKATIALNICQALTYLHSLAPPVIHRDLKSRNVLLNDTLKAKLSDFGISRERLDRTMTACVGTSLWMAPEVMLGERYDVKADMFSFGVVLSELDVHKMPYAVKENPGSSGREAAGVQLFQKIALGTVQVEFSDSSPRTLVELGRACTSLDPAERPNAAEAMYRLQCIIAEL